MELLAVDKPTNVIRALFGRLVSPSADLICGLGELVRQTYDSWELSSEEIADRHTPLPYYVSYATDRARIATYGAIKGNGETKAATILGHAASHVVAPAKFRFCAQCAREDITHYGEAYWRRSFQLPGVIVCPKHQLSLRESSVPTRPRSTREWYAGNTLITASLEDDSTQNPLWNGNPHVLEVARRSIHLLVSGSAESFPAMHEHYFALAQEAGLTRPSGIVDPDALSRGMKEMYGEDFLNATGLSVSAAQRLTWPREMMVRARASFQPLQHLLLSHFLEWYSTSVKGKGQTLTARQNFICPNPYANHGTGHVIERVKVEQTVEGRVGRGHCRCGLKFSFQQCRVGTAEPEIARVHEFGNDWREATRTMRRNGMSFSAISREMGVSVSTLKSMVRRKYASDATATKADVDIWRRDWELLLERVAPLGHEAAQKLNRGLYLRLNRYDKAWLRESGRRHWLKRSGGPRRERADWGGRDKVWSEALRAAAAKLYASVPRSKRVSRAAIISEADVHQFGQPALNRLPLCQAVLSELEESMEQFQIRRLEWGAQRLFDSAEVLTAAKLLKLACIRKNLVTPLILSTIARLTEEFGARFL
ncbi:TnsD family Tn7-like transposition protein [Ralstonia sp. R-29]|uniref:TnsD family Tn7-like transposition protein n=1 Tax=Ralstonia sp. R-29 TaxID=3404059 RepID=UPI003CE99035